MSARIPSGEEAGAGRAVLMEVLTVLGRYVDGMVLIGGWVPEIVFPKRGHVGSFDVDLALDPRRIPSDAYASIRTRLIEQGYVQTGVHCGVFTRELHADGGRLTVKLDLITGLNAASGSHVANATVQDLNIGRLRGVEIALDHAVSVTLSGALPSGVQNTVDARIVTVPAYLCMKAFALNERKKEKDAYDVYFCLRHFAGGPAALASDCSPLMKVPGAAEAFEVLGRKFETIHSIGPQWAADVASGQGDDRAMISRDAFERAQLFLRELGLRRV
ncbi:MAG: nucleotidyl transferase AbiEii/AbiGii toxin family protein [Planctomycetes bacterium]|nr:nucleotidyl transferase AbiEii/AbiGii toxin family protein [Planctomycetota bacterium]